MKNIEFKKLYIQNFLSVGNEPLEIEFNNGLNVITGYNRDENDIKNGVGKSCILDSFYFALFGTTMREISKLSYIVNRKVGKNCIVRLEADITDSLSGRDTYLIERKIAPQSLKIWKNGSEITKSTTAETNKFIEELFLAEKDIFQNCIIMRANNTIPFMAKKKADKKNFIETIFSLDIFSIMGRYLRDDIRAIKGEYSLEQNTLSIHEKSISDYNIQIENLLKIQEDYYNRRQEEIQAIKDKIVVEEGKIDEMKSVQKDLIFTSSDGKSKDDLQSELYEKHKFIDTLSKVKSNLHIEEGITRKELKKIESDTGICPTCKRAYDEGHLNEIIDEKNKLTEKLADIVGRLGTLETKETEINELISDISKALNEINENIRKFEFIETKIKESNRIIELYNEQIDSKNKAPDSSGIETFRNMVVETQKTIDEIKTKIEVLERSIGKMNICEHILGEYGVRAYIVNKLLDVFNNRIQYYLNAIKSTFNFRFNEYFEEEIKDSNGIICLYSNCSGAEMKKIDLAISFAINDMITLQKQVTYNVVFFDEILDSSVDDKSLNIILNFISEHTQNENKAVYIISHKSGAQIPFTNEVITLEKINGFTKRIIE